MKAKTSSNPCSSSRPNFGNSSMGGRPVPHALPDSSRGRILSSYPYTGSAADTNTNASCLWLPSSLAPGTRYPARKLALDFLILEEVASGYSDSGRQRNAESLEHRGPGPPPQDRSLLVRWGFPNLLEHPDEFWMSCHLADVLQLLLKSLSLSHKTLLFLSCR